MTTTTQAYELGMPSFFDPQKLESVWRVPYGERAQEAIRWRVDHDIKPAATDALKIALMPIDVQNTFCMPDFELFVGGRSGRGAIDDNVRLCEFIYRNIRVLTRIFPTMDTHKAAQIFHPIFWVDSKGNHPAPNTIITYGEVKAGSWSVNPAAAHSVLGDARKFKALQDFALHYVKQLEDGGKYPLMIWPFHAMLGGIGHALVSGVEEAIFFHNIARASQTEFQIKGGNALTENYSVLRPEVLTGPNGDPIAQKNSAFFRTLMEHDVLIIAGQAKSHCVAWTIQDLLDEIMAHDPKLARKVYLVEDLTSPVVVPGVIDFTDDADAAFRKFEAAGMHVVNSTTPIAQWDGIAL